MRRAPLLIVPLSNKDAYLDRYAEPDKGWTDRDESRWPVPYWDVDAGMAVAADAAHRGRRGAGRLLLRRPAATGWPRSGRRSACPTSTGRSAASRSATPATTTAAPRRCAAAGAASRRSCTAALVSDRRRAFAADDDPAVQPALVRSRLARIGVPILSEGAPHDW